jgi:hypothetical protein
LRSSRWSATISRWWLMKQELDTKDRRVAERR